MFVFLLLFVFIPIVISLVPKRVPDMHQALSKHLINKRRNKYINEIKYKMFSNKTKIFKIVMNKTV